MINPKNIVLRNKLEIEDLIEYALKKIMKIYKLILFFLAKTFWFLSSTFFPVTFFLITITARIFLFLSRFFMNLLFNVFEENVIQTLVRSLMV